MKNKMQINHRTHPPPLHETIFYYCLNPFGNEFQVIVLCETRLNDHVYTLYNLLILTSLLKAEELRVTSIN